MKKASLPLKRRAVLIALTAIFVFTALGASTASAISVKLRVEGASTTQFNGTVNTGPRFVPGGVDDPTGCRANGTGQSFSSPNGLTALTDALGDGNVGTSGTFFSFGTLLCKVNSEIPTTAGGGWLFRINQTDSTAPNGYVTGTDPLSDGDKVLIYLSPSYGYFSSALELRLPEAAKPGQPVTGFVDSYSTADDSKSLGTGVTVSGGGASATSDANGGVSLTFPTAGRYLVTATRSGAIRGSQWVTVAADAVVTPVTPPKTVKQLRAAARRKCLRAYKWHRTSSPRYKKCVARANRLGKKK
ncbi:MAG: hypothetical protein JHC98_11550 [Thermoleophilaceae bacterium]|nr:hypothetical protein [Thermoleophilaceae bacterium]